MGKELSTGGKGGNSGSEPTSPSSGTVCHVAAFQVPRRGFFRALAKSSVVQRLAIEGKPGGIAVDPNIGSGGAEAAPWEAHLTTCVMEGTMATTPLQLPLAEYGVPEEGRVAHREGESKRRRLERLSGRPLRGQNQFAFLDVEVQQDRLDGRDGGPPPRGEVLSDFYQSVVQMWCPGLSSCGWFNGEGVPFLDLAVCRSCSPREFGVPFGVFVREPERMVLEPSYVVNAACAAEAFHVLESEMPVCFPPPAPRARPPVEEWETALASLAEDFTVGPRAHVGQLLVRGYTSYRLDPGEVTESLVADLRGILSNRVLGYRWFDYRKFELAEDVTLVEMRMYADD